MASYTLRYSALFLEDLNQITDYFATELGNVPAALALITDIEIAIKKYLLNPLSPAVYQSMATRPNEYRRIIVGNYLVFYVVIDTVMIVRRLLYGPREIDRIL